MGARERLQSAYDDIGREKNNDNAAKEVRKLRKELKPPSNTGKKVIGMFAKGFGDIGKSLATPYSKRRPKIANLSPHRPDISIEPDLSVLRDHDMFGNSIRKR